MYSERIKAHMGELVKRLYALYGSRWDFYIVLQKMAAILDAANGARSDELRAQDERREKAPDWFLDRREIGITLYVDLFAGDLSGLEAKIPYLVSLGITYVHLMPLFRSPTKHNDGGYAVSSYREVDPRLGSIAQLAETAALFREAGIALVLDFVFNHTSDEHEWAMAAKRGDESFRDFYFIFHDKSDADDWNRMLREIFPDTRRGSFTFVKAVGGWVWTTFNAFQWDLNYSNPYVFLAMCEELLSLANLGVDVLRLDALAFVWKKPGTTCENLPETHLLIQAFQYVARIAAPSLAFKSEAIVHPDEVIGYIGIDECRLSYNPLQMALFWEALATRNTRLLSHSLARRWVIPSSCGWVNYIRCHDDIGWTFSDEDARECGIDGYEHRRFLNRFYTNRFEGTFARGEPFQYNPGNEDCRVCGTMASLAGLEDAYDLHRTAIRTKDAVLAKRADLYADMAVRRILMMYAVLFGLPGIPLLYAGDEGAMLNDYSYREDDVKKKDSRWVHRVQTNWDHTAALERGVTEKNDWLGERQSRVFRGMKQLIQTRKTEEGFSGADVRFLHTGNDRVFAFCRDASARIFVLANFSEERTTVCLPEALYGRDLLSDREFFGEKILELSAYEKVWLKASSNGAR